jgi:hypothetical protein
MPGTRSSVSPIVNVDSGHTVIVRRLQRDRCVARKIGVTDALVATGVELFGRGPPRRVSPKNAPEFLNRLPDTEPAAQLIARIGDAHVLQPDVGQGALIKNSCNRDFEAIVIELFCAEPGCWVPALTSSRLSTLVDAEVIEQDRRIDDSEFWREPEVQFETFFASTFCIETLI